MITYRQIDYKDYDLVIDLYNREVSKARFYKPLSHAEFVNHFFKHPEFNKDLTFIAYKDDKIVGLSSGHIRKIEQDNDECGGYLTTVLVASNYRRLGIGSNLVKLVEAGINALGKKKITLSYLSTLNWPWFIPSTPDFDHPGAPGASVNSDLYLFLYSLGYEAIDHQDAFCLELANYTMPENVKAKQIINQEEGYIISLYNPKFHFNLDKFYQEINSEPFERVIKQNLNQLNPKPFLVISKAGQILGWTGAMWTEPSGRAHFDGIAISPQIRGRGLGQTLFCELAMYSKEQGSKFMTFFTGRNNHARFIYKGAGFKIIQSFAILEKGI